MASQRHAAHLPEFTRLLAPHAAHKQVTGNSRLPRIQYVPRNMHTVCAVYWLSDSVACSGRVWDYVDQYASDIC